MVAAAAKVSVPTVFHYFNSSEALVDAVLSEVARLYGSALMSAGRSSLPPQETLQMLLHTLVNTIDTHPDYVQIFTEWSISARSGVWPRYLKLYRLIIRTVAKVVEAGQRSGIFRADLNPEDEAAILHATSGAFIQMKAMGAKPERMEAFQRSIMQSVSAPQVRKARAKKSVGS
jgi:TetR/AcrR family hemagglutinin/protease transcriptional regulator